MSLFHTLLSDQKVRPLSPEILNGYNAIDLGIVLDNGNHLLFADRNVGASSPEDYGDYFMWASVTPNNNDVCNWNDPKVPYQTANASSYRSTKWTKYLGSITSSYKDPAATDEDALKTVLDPEDDAAHVIMGGDWRMPTKDELYKLVELPSTWATENGVYGRKWTSGNYTLFIPAGGFRNSGSFRNQGSQGYVWGSSLNTSAPFDAFSAYFNSSRIGSYEDFRCYGLPIRGVIELTPKQFISWQSETSISEYELWYTTSDNKITQSTNQYAQASLQSMGLVSNTYKNGYGVMKFNKEITTIGEHLFDACTTLTSVRLPKSVTRIGMYAFTGTSISHINLPTTITDIDAGAFSWCTQLTQVVLSPRITEIKINTFADCHNLAHITIPNGVTTIGQWAFKDCHYLSSVTLPNSITSIGLQAFQYCYTLNSISNLQNIALANGVFWGCGFTKLPEGLSCISDNLFSNNNFVAISIPSGITSIAPSAFSFCSDLCEVNIPGSVQIIGSSAFDNCPNIASVSISNGVIEIGSFAFRSCSALKSITLPSSITTIASNAFTSCRYLKTISYSGTATGAPWGATNATIITN